MPIPGNSEPGTFSGQQQVQGQPSVNFSSAIPIKKRRFPMFQEKPVCQEEKITSTEEKSPISGGLDSKNKADRNLPEEEKSLSEARNTVSSANSDMNRMSPSSVKSEATPINLQLGQTNTDTSGSKALEAKPSFSLGPLDDLGNKKETLQGEKCSKSAVLGSSIAAQIVNVKKEVFSGQTEGTHRGELSTGKLNVQLLLGPKEPPVAAAKHDNSEAHVSKSDKMDSLLTLGLQEQKLNLPDKTGSTMGNDGNRASSNRLNWDLNTTMDVWEGSTTNDAFAHRLLDVGGLGKTNSCHDDKSLLTTAGVDGLLSNKGKSVVDGHASSVCNVSAKPSQLYKTDDSLGLLTMPCIGTSQELSLSDNLVSSGMSPNINVQQEQLSIMNVNKMVKSEPVEDNSKRDCSSGSSSSSSMELLKISSVKREIANNQSLESVLPSSISPKKIECRSIKSEVVQESHQEASKSEDASPLQSVGRLMNFQESCASSSALVLPLVHLNPCPSSSPTCSKLTTCGDLSFHSKNLHQNEVPDSTTASDVSKPAGQDSVQIIPYKVGSLSVADTDKHELAGVDGHMHELSQKNESAGMIEEDAYRSDFESQQNCAADNVCRMEDEEYEDGEVREPMQPAAGEDSIVLDCLGKDVDIHSDDVNSDVEESLRPEVQTDALTDRSPGIGIEQGDEEAIEKVVNEHSSIEDVALSKVEEPLEGPDAVKDSNNVGNKSRIINLSRAVVTSPCKTKSIPNRLLTSRSGKEGYSDLDGEMQQRGNRDEFYTGGSNKFVKDRAHDQSFRNFRPNFMRGKGRMSGRFGSLHREWNSDHKFSSESSYGPYDNRVFRRKHAPTISDVDIECNSYGFRQDGDTFVGNRRKLMNDESPSARRTSFRRLSSGDRDGPMTRGMQMLRGNPRNMSPRRCPNEAGPDVMGLRPDDKFMRLSDEVVDPDYDRPQGMYDELNGQLVRGNRNFINMQRKGYSRIHSKSPVRSRSRSPGPWSSPRRRSPNGPPEFTQHRPPALFRTGRMRSPDRSCFRDEMVPRRRGSPPFVTRHNNDLRDGGDSGREHVHPRPVDSNRRTSPGRGFPRNTRRADERPRPNRFYPNRFYPNEDADFAERNNMREREFDGQIKHQPMIVSRRIRNNIEEQQDGNYRPVERVWHGDGFTDTRGKKRRF